MEKLSTCKGRTQMALSLKPNDEEQKIQMNWRTIVGRQFQIIFYIAKGRREVVYS